MLVALLLIPIALTAIASEPIVYEAEEPVVVLIEEKIDWTPERVKQEIREAFPDNELALQVAWCESRWIWDAEGPTDDWGPFQIHRPSHGERLGELGLDIHDPEDNIKYAKMLYDRQGWQPWDASKHCWN